MLDKNFKQFTVPDETISQAEERTAFLITRPLNNYLSYLPFFLFYT